MRFYDRQKFHATQQSECECSSCSLKLAIHPGCQDNMQQHGIWRVGNSFREYEFTNWHHYHSQGNKQIRENLSHGITGCLKTKVYQRLNCNLRHRNAYQVFRSVDK